MSDTITVGGHVFTRIPYAEMTVERTLSIEARIMSIEAYGLTPETYDDMLNNIQRALTDETGDYYKTANNAPMRFTDRKNAALNILEYLKAAKSYRLQSENLLGISLCFYTIDGETPEMPQNRYHKQKQALVMADNKAFVFFCVFGAKMLQSCKNLGDNQILKSLQEATSIMTMLRSLLDLPQ